MGIAISGNKPTLSSTSAQQPSASLYPEGTLHFATDTKLLTRRNAAGNWEAVPVGPLNLLADPKSYDSGGGTITYDTTHEVIGTTATTATVNLPGATLGRRVRLHQTGAGVTTFQRQSSDTIGASGATTITLAQGEWVELVCLVLGNWRIVARGSRDASAGVQAFTATGTIVGTGPRRVTFVGSSGQTLTLPAASVVGRQFVIDNVDSADSVTVARAGSDTIGGGVTSIVVPPGGSVELSCRTSGVWDVKWPTGQQLAAGYGQRTSNLTSAGTATSVTVAGDGVTPVAIEGFAASIRTNAAAGNTVTLAIQDTSTQVQVASFHNGGANYGYSANPKVTVPAFTGSKTFNLVLATSSGTPAIDAGATLPCWIRAAWAPGNATS